MLWLQCTSIFVHMKNAHVSKAAVNWSKWKWVRFLVVFYIIAVFTNMMGCSFYYLEPENQTENYLPIPSEVNSIIFASCNNQNIQSPVFELIQNMHPDLFIWTGDIIYPDWPIPWPGNNLDKIAHKYNLLQNSQGYRHLAASVPVTGIYDDHDFGQNNGGATYPYRRESKQLLQQFFREDENAERSQHEGAYTWYRFQSGNLNYAVILLDTRYYREKPGKNSQLLGSEQWKWLEDVLAIRELDLLMIVSGTSVLSIDTENEGWKDYPSEKERLFDLLDQVQIPTVFVAGDKHYGEINTDNIHGRNYYEMVASGITHTEAPAKSYVNNILHSQRYVGVNFGRILLPDSPENYITIQVVDNKGHVQLEQSMILDPTFVTHPPKLKCAFATCSCRISNSSAALVKTTSQLPSLLHTLQTTTSYQAGIQID